MSVILVAEFQSRNQAALAIQQLISANVPREAIDTYPSLVDTKLREPNSGEKVAGAETPLSSNGPLGHLQAIVAKVFNAGEPDPHALSSSEPTQELTDKAPAFLFIHMEGRQASMSQLQALLTEAGAARVADHEM